MQAKIDINKVNHYLFTKHNIIPGTQVKNIEEVSRNHLGLHSARIMTPYTTLCSRIEKFGTKMLMQELYENRKLIKLRCMRTTLHIVPFDIAPIVHKATLPIRIAEPELFFKRNNIDKQFIGDMQDYLEAEIDYPVAPDIIESLIKKRLNIGDEELSKKSAKMILKYMWEIGSLCYVNDATSWEKEERKYGVCKKYYSNLDLSQYTIKSAQQKLIYEYVDKFGPVTLKDIGWWTGLGTRLTQEVINKDKTRYIKCSLGESTVDFYMSEKGYEALEKFKNPELEWIALLAYEDPSLKGYFESRYRYVQEKNYNLLFNQIGEVRASIIYNGQAVGIWVWNKKNKNVEVKYFDKPSKKLKAMVEEKQEVYNTILYENQQMRLW